MEIDVTAPFEITGPHAAKDRGKEYFLIGPDGLIWHRSWAEYMLIKWQRELTTAFDYGEAEGKRSKLELIAKRLRKVLCEQKGSNHVHHYE